MNRWNIKETEEHVERLFGREQRARVKPCLQSVAERQNYARYHYHEANDIYLRFANKHLAEASLFEIIGSRDDDTQTEFQRSLTNVGANLLACIQNIHAIADILAHAIYYALGMNLAKGALGEAGINAHAVITRTSAVPETAQIGHLLSTLVNEKPFLHVTALTNHSKHRSIIRTSFSEDMTGQANDRHTFKLSGFTYKEDFYPMVDARHFIQQAFDQASVLVVDIGNALNHALELKMPTPST